MTTFPDPDAIVAEHWPLHGPYSDEHTHYAGATLVELVRYLNYATMHGADSMPYASTANGLVGHLSSAVASLDQTLRQLKQRCAQFEGDPTLYDDATYEHGEAVSRVRSARASLEDAQWAADALRRALRESCSHLVHVGHHDPAESRGAADETREAQHG